MTRLMDKIRAVLGRPDRSRRSETLGSEELSSEELGSPDTEGHTVPPGEPTLGASLGMDVADLLRRGEEPAAPQARTTDERD
ncbi:MAG TPA: hypothetical protein VMU95_05610 [Trebonia sp.]|nr:hypothetical protein [Trebonia sp.]